MWGFIYSSKPLEKYIIEELIKPSSIEEEMRDIAEIDIKKLFDPWNWRLKNIISSFNKDHLEQGLANFILV